MLVILRATSSKFAHVLFDDQAIDATLSMAAQTRAGNVLHLVTDANDLSAGLVVDEEPPGDWMRGADLYAKECLLKIVSGKVRLTGEESMRSFPSEGESALIPPGNYLCDVYSVEYGRDSLHGFVKRRLMEEGLGERSDMPAGAGCLATLLLSGLLFALKIGDLGEKAIQWVLLTGGVPLTLYWLILYVRSQRPQAKAWRKRAKELDTEFQQTHPDIVIAIKRLKEGSDLSRFEGAVVHL